jgi:hypothetical protein
VTVLCSIPLARIGVKLKCIELNYEMLNPRLPVGRKLGKTFGVVVFTFTCLSFLELIKKTARLSRS